ncbi:MAG: DUF932 domain-containing protein [Bacteroidota bacterium]
MAVFNSTNAQHALLMTCGLFRQLCENGMSISAGTNEFQIRSKHSYKAIPKITELFYERLSLINSSYIRQIEYIKSLENKEMSAYTCFRSLTYDTNGNQLATMLEVCIRLSKYLLTSKTDKIKKEDYSENQLKSLKQPVKFLERDPDCEDLQLPLITIYNCYTELFKNRNSAIKEKENIRIAEVLAKHM